MSGMVKVDFMRAIFILFTFFLIFPAVTCASEFMAGEDLFIKGDEIINDDIYFAGNSVTVDGTINGDLIAAGGIIMVRGTINGTLMAAGGTITVTGDVTNDIRAAGGSIRIAGDVGDNVLVFGENIILDKDARISKDLTMGAGSADIAGTVNGDINGGADNMELKGTTMGNVTVDIGETLKVQPGATIGGNLEYTGPKQGEISGTIAGKTVFKEKIKEEGYSRVGGEIIGYFWLLLVGIVFLTLAPVMSRSIADAISSNPLKNLLWGLLFLIATPILAILLLITVIGIPISFLLMALYIVEIYISRVFVGFWTGQYVLKRLGKGPSHNIIALALGLLIVIIGINLPFLGWFIHFLIIILGLGALVLTQYGVYRGLKEQKSI